MAESVEEQNTQKPRTCCGYKVPGKEEYEPCGINLKHLKPDNSQEDDDIFFRI